MVYNLSLQRLFLLPTNFKSIQRYSTGIREVKAAEGWLLLYIPTPV